VDAGIDSFIAKPILVDEVSQLVSELARQPSGAWSAQSGNRQAPARALPGDYLGVAGTASTSGADIAPDPGEMATIIPIEPADNAFTPEYVEEEIAAGVTTPDDVEFALEAIPDDPTDFLHDEEAGSPDSSPYLFARLAEAETNGFSGATRPTLNAEIDDACVIAIDRAGTLVMPGIEASYDNSDDNWPAANARLSAPAGLALLEATCQLTAKAASLVTPDNGPAQSADWNPFEQARKSLSNARFGARVIHNDGDPSDRNLI
jgi:hypothetical protein